MKSLYFRLPARLFFQNGILTTLRAAVAGFDRHFQEITAMPLHAEHCALSRQRELPDLLDSWIETRQPDLPLAILTAFFDARRVSVPSVRTSVQTVQSPAKPLYEPVCCENFA